MAAIAFTKYDPATGRILGMGYADADGAYPQEDGVAVLPFLPPQDGKRYLVRDEEFVLDASPAHYDYAEARRMAYPSVGEQLDELWRAVDALSQGQPLPFSVTQMRDAIMLAKMRFPKQKGNT